MAQTKLAVASIIRYRNSWVMVKGTNRVLRGGSWNNKPRNVRSANRNNNTPDNRNNNVGFRVAQAQTPAVAAVDQTSILPVVFCITAKSQCPPVC
jgi:hypothetical protein